MAAVHPYQRVLLANRDILLSDLPTEDVINFLEDQNVLSIKETDDIKIGRSQRERRESLLDVLHYKGERGFNEFCKALDEYAPNLADRMSDKDPKPEQNGEALATNSLCDYFCLFTVLINAEKFSNIDCTPLHQA